MIKNKKVLVSTFFDMEEYDSLRKELTDCGVEFDEEYVSSMYAAKKAAEWYKFWNKSFIIRDRVLNGLYRAGDHVLLVKCLPSLGDPVFIRGRFDNWFTCLQEGYHTTGFQIEIFLHKMRVYVRLKVKDVNSSRIVFYELRVRRRDVTNSQWDKATRSVEYAQKLTKTPYKQFRLL